MGPRFPAVSALSCRDDEGRGGRLGRAWLGVRLPLPPALRLWVADGGESHTETPPGLLGRSGRGALRPGTCFLGPLMTPPCWLPVAARGLHVGRGGRSLSLQDPLTFSRPPHFPSIGCAVMYLTILLLKDTNVLSNLLLLQTML